MTTGVSITELHLCSECKLMIEIPGKTEGSWEVGCLHKKGKPNPSGGLTECEFFIN